MAGLFSFFSNQHRIITQQQEIKKLQAELEKLQQQNDSMRQGMRRCVTCDYRIKAQQHDKN
ncbi:hypothetical protein [Oceanicoccus sp. KOV_DT_Chl]|uniref:hypothetical protein n=1 Tax=Oceanicoccus sp. KOV_DT_Chl TaxID=1904639 RepID=UPI000C7B9B56|nr:hypothetical protein [Oceanicoccus sp. KOV_DT_Chl]